MELAAILRAFSPVTRSALDCRRNAFTIDGRHSRVRKQADTDGGSVRSQRSAWGFGCKVDWSSDTLIASVRMRDGGEVCVLSRAPSEMHMMACLATACQPTTRQAHAMPAARRRRTQLSSRVSTWLRDCSRKEQAARSNSSDAAGRSNSSDEAGRSNSSDEVGRSESGGCQPLKRGGREDGCKRAQARAARECARRRRARHGRPARTDGERQRGADAEAGRHLNVLVRLRKRSRTSRAPEAPRQRERIESSNKLRRTR
eukprot:4372000-Pleurochrysis_carterae.AAC.2